MKKIFSYIAATMLSLSLAGCMDLEPTSSITDSNYWKNADQVQTFNQGLYSWVRSYANRYIIWGELRSNIYTGTAFSGEAPQGYERLWNNTLEKSSAVIGNYGGLYTGINQINLMIDKVNEAGYLTEAQKNKYLASSHGLRAFFYFQLLRTYGDVIVYLQHTEGKTVDLSKVARKQDPAADVMKQIKADIQASETAYNNDYSFKDGRMYWSLAATKMLKGEVYLWSGKQMGGGTADYQTALTAYQEVQSHADVALLDNFSDVFAYNKKGNKEIIFALHNRENETTLWNGLYTSLVMNKQNVSAYRLHDAHGNAIQFSQSEYLNLSLGTGVMRFPLDKQLWTKLYLNGNDKRRAGSLADVYATDGTTYVGNICNKFHGTLLPGGSSTSWYDDQPIYRYAECLLGIAEAKVLLGQNPATEINQIRSRAYGAAYFNAHPEVQYPNEVSTGGTPALTTFFANNTFVGGDENAEETVLKERMREFLFEGKRWHDIRLFNKAVKYSTANNTRLLWPIDETTLSTNTLLEQTPGYGD